MVDLCTVATAKSVSTTSRCESNAAAAAPLTYDASIADRRPQPVLAPRRLRFVGGTGSGDAINVGMFGNGKLPIYANRTRDSATNFYLARVLAAGRGSGVLQLHFFDIGDVSGGRYATILPPADRHPRRVGDRRAPAAEFTTVGDAAGLTGCIGGDALGIATAIKRSIRRRNITVPPTTAARGQPRRPTAGSASR